MKTKNQFNHGFGISVNQYFNQSKFEIGIDYATKNYVYNNGGTRRYLFVVVDTTFNGLDTTYGISFRPRKGG